MNEKSPETLGLNLDQKIVFSVVCVSTSLCAAVGNGIYLHCYHVAQRFTSHFYMLAAFVSLCHLTHALVMMSLNLAVLFRPSLDVCAAFRTSVYIIQLETTLLLLIIVYDRVMLIRGGMLYRQNFRFRRHFHYLVLLSSIACFVFTTGYTYYWLNTRPAEVHEKDEDPAKYCYAYPTYYPDFGSALKVIMDIFSLWALFYVERVSRKIHVVLNKIQTLDKQELSDKCTHLSPRTDAAYGLHDTQVKNVSPKGSTTASVNTLAVTGHATKSSNEAAALRDQTSTHEERKEGTSCREESGMARHSVAFDKATEISSATFRSGGSDKSKFTYSTSEGPENNTNPVTVGTLSAPTETRHSRWSQMFMRKITSVSSQSLRLDTRATHQMEVLVLIHVIGSIPWCVSLFMASIMTEGAHAISSFMHWLTWLSSLEAILFPIILCLYSSKIRTHFYQHLCCLCSRRPVAKVTSEGVGVLD